VPPYFGGLQTEPWTLVLNPAISNYFDPFVPISIYFPLAKRAFEFSRPIATIKLPF
jgi:hypothetical protein